MVIGIEIVQWIDETMEYYLNKYTHRLESDSNSSKRMVVGVLGACCLIGLLRQPFSQWPHTMEDVLFSTSHMYFTLLSYCLTFGTLIQVILAYKRQQWGCLLEIHLHIMLIACLVIPMTGLGIYATFWTLYSLHGHPIGALWMQSLFYLGLLFGIMIFKMG